MTIEKKDKNGKVVWKFDEDSGTMILSEELKPKVKKAKKRKGETIDKKENQ